MDYHEEESRWTTEHYVCRDRRLPGGGLVCYEPQAGPFATAEEAAVACERMQDEGLYCATFRCREAD